jgi:hypothetical protein
MSFSDLFQAWRDDGARIEIQLIGGLLYDCYVDGNGIDYVVVKLNGKNNKLIHIQYSSILTVSEVL